MEYEAFKALQGRDIGIAGPSGELTARVDSVTRLGDSPGDSSRVPFSVVLKAPLEPLLEQRIYQLTVDGQTLELFMVPIGPEGAQMCYEIIFS
jgi:hypothetical protein